MSDCPAVDYDVLIEAVDAAGLGVVDKISIVAAKTNRLKPVL